MGAREFGLLVDQEMRERQIGASKLAARVGELPDGRMLDATGVRLIRQGRREKYDTELVRRIAVALGIDEDYAYWTAGVWPADLDVEDYRRLRHAIRASRTLSPGSLGTVDELERRRRDRRRRRVPAVEPLEVAA